MVDRECARIYNLHQAGKQSDVAGFVDEMGIEKHPLSDGCPFMTILSGVNVSDNADIADFLEIAGHDRTSIRTK